MCLTGLGWSSRRWGWSCRGKCPPRSPSSRARSAPSACSASGCTCARGTAASASQCWCPRRCAWSGMASRAPGGRGVRSCPSSPGEMVEEERKESEWKALIFCFAILCCIYTYEGLLTNRTCLLFQTCALTVILWTQMLSFPYFFPLMLNFTTSYDLIYKQHVKPPHLGSFLHCSYTSDH